MRRALTTVEALIASAVVIVFLAIGYPAARALTGRAHQSACAERLHTLGAGLALYANDHDGALPAATTAEWAYQSVKDVPADELKGSPALLRELIKPYVPGEEAWFCPLDPHRGEDALWLGQRHRLTGFRYDPRSSGEEAAWPPRSQLGKESGPLLSDAYGVPAKDSDPAFRSVKAPTSNHPDGTVNLLGQDLSLSRKRAKDLVGL